MERLLAYEGPVVHVDHAHRAPAPTSFSTREVAEERKECNRHLQKVHDDYEAKLLAKDDELAKSRRTKQAAINRLAEEVSEDEAERRRLEAEVTELTDKLAEDNKNYMKLLNGPYNEAKSKFVFAHAMAASKAKEADPVALQHIRWVQEKLVELLGEDAAKRAVNKDAWF